MIVNSRASPALSPLRPELPFVAPVPPAVMATLVRCQFVGCGSADIAGAVIVQQSDIWIEAVTFARNIAPGHGSPTPACRRPPLFPDPASSLLTSYVLFHCLRPSCGRMQITSPPYPPLPFPVARLHAGSIDAQNSSLYISGSTFKDNRDTTDSSLTAACGTVSAINGSVALWDCAFTKNTAQGNYMATGGGLCGAEKALEVARANSVQRLVRQSAHSRRCVGNPSAGEPSRRRHLHGSGWRGTLCSACIAFHYLSGLWR